MRHDSVTRARLAGLRTGQRGESQNMDDREAGTYSTPPEAAPGEAEARAARDRMSSGLPVLIGSIFAGAFLVGLIALLVYLL